jgi:hypothetical protein
MIANKLTTKCERCGAKAEVEVVPDDWQDAPASFTITRTCFGACPKTYASVTPQQMHEITRRPLTGWAQG